MFFFNRAHFAERAYLLYLFLASLKFSSPRKNQAAELPQPGFCLLSRIHIEIQLESEVDHQAHYEGADN